MSKSSIGIKIANGSYYKILEEAGARARKRLVLTTVKDNQTSVQIDLYRGEDSQISDAQYIGSLVIDSIRPVPKGEPDIELVIGIDKEGTLNATASDRASGERQTLAVSMASLSEEGTYDVPEFALEDRFEPTNGVSSAETSGLTSAQPEPVPEPVNRRPVGGIVLGVLLGLVVVAIIVVLVVRFTGPRAAAPPVATRPAAAAQAATPAPAPVQQAAPAAQPAPSSAQAATTPQGRYGGVNYYIRWGDTLWDLSISFYRTPWLYGKIAKANSIKNPDLIFAHTTIFIPDR